MTPHRRFTYYVCCACRFASRHRTVCNCGGVMLNAYRLPVPKRRNARGWLALATALDKRYGPMQPVIDMTKERGFGNAMRFMSEHSIEGAVEQFKHHPTLGPASHYLRAWVGIVNGRSDRWPHWTPAIKAAERLIALVDNARVRDGLINQVEWKRRKDPTWGDVLRATRPIERFIQVRRTAEKLQGMPPEGLIPYPVDPVTWRESIKGRVAR